MKRILLVDDDDPLRQTCARILTRAGFQVIEVCNGNEAIATLRVTSVDLMITDLIMPEKEGIEVISAVRISHPGLPIIAISGGGRVSAGDYLEIAQKIGANVALAKPFSGATLIAEINRLLHIEPLMSA